MPTPPNRVRNDIEKETVANTSQEIAQVKALISEVNSLEAGKRAQSKAYRDLVDIYPRFASAQQGEVINTQKLTQNWRRL